MAEAAAEDIKQEIESPPVDNDNPFANISPEELARMRGDVVDEAPETPDQVETPSEPEPEPEPEPEVAEAVEESDGDVGSRSEEAGELESEAEPEAAPVMLPKSRFDAVNQRYREEQARREALETRIAELEKQTGADAAPTSPQHDAQLLDINKKIANAVAEGDTDKFSELSAQKDALQMQIFESKLASSGSANSEATIENIKFDLFLDQLESIRPELKAESDVFDEAKSIETVDLMEAFQAKGHSKTDALERALNYIYPEGWRNVQQSTEERQPEAAAPQKRETDKSKNAQAAASQPPPMTAGETSSAVGLRDKIDPFTLSDEEFQNLTDEQLAELRGDNF